MRMKVWEIPNLPKDGQISSKKWHKEDKKLISQLIVNDLFGLVIWFEANSCYE